MVENSVVGHVEHAVVILHQRRRVEDGLAQEPGQRRRIRQLLDSRDGVLICGRVLWLVKVDQVLGDLATVRLWRGHGLALGRRQDLLTLRRSLSGGLRIRGLLLMGVVRVNLDVVDEVVAKVDSGGQVGRRLHDTIHQEADMVGAGEDVDGGAEAPGPIFAVLIYMSVKQANLHNVFSPFLIRPCQGELECDKSSETVKPATETQERCG